MRRTPPLILGAGPAGSMAAIALAAAGVRPVLIDRDAEVGDALCGGFLSWRTAQRLREVGIGPIELGAQVVERLALIAGPHETISPLPSPGFGLSRRVLDRALRQRAVAMGAELVIDRIRSVEDNVAQGEDRAHKAEAMFLATGKHDVRGLPRPRASGDLALGLRIRIPADPGLRALLARRIELHLFHGGYAGIVLQEDGSANVCLALRKSSLACAGGDPRDLLAALAIEHEAFGRRMAYANPDLPIETIGAVPYGWIARATEPGIYRLGDQAAVIPSLAGEGIAIALASGSAAAEAWLAGETAEIYQRRFARQVRRPVALADLVWRIAERAAGGRALAGVMRAAPGIARLAMRLTRVG